MRKNCIILKNHICRSIIWCNKINIFSIYKDFTIFASVILEAIAICFSAVLLGLLLTALMIPALETLSGELFADVVSLSSGIIIGGFLIGLLIAFISAAVPAYQALNLKVVDALREG